MKDFPLFISHLEKLISFKSVCAPALPNKPFGEEINGALNYFLDLAKSFGFDTVDYDGYIGEVSFGKSNTCDEIGIIGHLDVVPTGIGWQTDPFKLTFKDGKYFGRGIQDDKAPLLACLFALKELKDSGIPCDRKFRLIVGCDEETGWRDVKYFATKSHFPEYGFSPDGNFPLSYAEKGITEVSFYLPPFKNFSSTKGGTVVNAVCDYAQTIPTDVGINSLLMEKYGLKYENGLIKSYGKSAHGSTPHLGANAIKPLLQYMGELGEDVDKVIDSLFNDKYELSKIKTEQGNVTLSPDLISTTDEGVVITCDLRTPHPVTLDEVSKVFDKFNLPYKLKMRHPTQCVEKEGWFVSSLINAYNGVTGENATPVSIGGSTFARAFKKGCAFGPEFVGSNGNIHDANENMKKDDLIKAYRIYKDAIFNLAKKN